MDLTIRPVIKKTLLGLTVAFLIFWFGLWFYVDGQYHYLRAKVSLYSTDIETTELWQVSDSWSYCGRTKNGGFVSIDNAIYQGIVAEEACIETQ